MSTILLDSNNLLSYNPTHQILICLSCQYAIQKSALPSHLLRHKIYRQEKARLLHTISLLSLLDPDLVPLPTPNSDPIDGLAVIDGWCCVKDNCGNLCASEKRMRWHWSEVHGLKDLEGEGWKRRCKLQTFFRGTKIRYFEVAAGVVSNRHGVERGSEEEVPQVNGYVGTRDEVDTEMLDELEQSLPPISTPLSTPPGRILDLETLTYFHHFTTSTSYTLPTTSSKSRQNWQTGIIPIALQHQNIMHGILAISAFHCSFLAPSKTQHLLSAKEFSRNFVNNTAKKDEESTNQIQLILYLSSLSLASANTFSIHNLLSTMRSHSSSKSKSQPQPPLLSCTTNIPPPLLNTLDALPYNLAKAYPSPSNSEAEDIFAVLNAIRDLIACVGISYASNNSVGSISSEDQERGEENRWRGMITWTTLVSDRFLRLIEGGGGNGGAGPAEIVVSFWAVLLLKRAKIENDDDDDNDEKRGGYWFLTGLADRVRDKIVKELPVHARVLVEDW